MELKTFFAQDLQGNVIPNPVVSVFLPGTTTLVTGLQNASGGALSNPFTGGSTGQISLAAPNGDYDIQIVGADRNLTMRVRFFDALGLTSEMVADDDAGGSRWTTVGEALQYLASNPGGGGGGGGLPALGGTSLSPFSLTHATANDRIVFTDTNPAGWNISNGRMSVTFDMTSVDYFSKNPNGHLAVVLRANTATIATAISGQGVAIGDLRGLVESASDLNPTPLLETWFNGQGGLGQLLWADSDGARSLGGMVDGVKYRFQIDSTVTDNGLARYLRYRQWYLDTTKSVPQWLAMVDTGDVLDSNFFADLGNTGLVFLHVFDSPAQTWTVNFENPRVVWGPAENPAPDQTTKLSRFGANLDGDLRFRKSGQRISVNCQTTDLGQRTAVMPSTANTAGSLLVQPSGSSTAANFAAVNSSNPSASYRIATFGMNGNDALIETFNLSQPGVVPLKINIGPGNTRFTLSEALALFASGTTVEAPAYKVTGATKNIGAPIGTYNNMYGWGGAAATSHNNTNTLDLEGFCGIGLIRQLLQDVGSSASFSDRNAIEIALRPIYCIVSGLVKDLLAKKVI